MQKVAEEAGLTIGFISQIERGLASPSLSSLAAVSRVLDLDTSELFAQPPSPGAMTTAGLRPVYGIDPANMTYERISSSFPGNVLRAVLIHEAPGHRSEPIRHEGEELFYILHGALTVEIEGQRQVLKPGDSIHFASTRVHSSWNHTDQPTTILHVCTMDVFGDGARSEHLTTTKDNQRG
jgi:quercetin dioxygenase-like cupin family protein